MAIQVSGRGLIRAHVHAKKRTGLSNIREALLCSAATLGIIAGSSHQASAACDAPVTVGGIEIITCSGAITSTDSPAVSYTSYTSPFEIISKANITTKGANALGIYGYGEGSYVLVNSTGSIKATGSDAIGIAAIGRNNIAIALFDGSVQTSGANAYGIFANSISTGFGNSGIYSIGSITTSGANAHGLYSTTWADTSGPISPTGAMVRIIAESNIVTTGAGARGIFADNFANGTSGSGYGDVTVTLKGTVSTYGDNAEGILVVNRTTGATTVTSSGAITTYGQNSHGIYVSDTATSGNGNIGITASAAIKTLGGNSDGIRAEAAGAAGTMNITVTDKISTSTANSTAVRASSGGAIGISVGGAGKLSSVLTAIDATGSSVSVRNAGQIDGSVIGNGVDSSLVNEKSGTMNSGSEITLGSSGTFTNAGTLSPGGVGALRTTTLTGNFAQSSTGRMLVDMSWSTGTADKLAATGSASVAGTLVVNPVDLGSKQGLSRSFTVLTAAGGIVDNGVTVTNTAAATYTISKPDANTLNLDSAIDFRGSSAAGLTDNQKAVGAALNQIFTGGTSLGFMPALLTVSTSQYANAIRQLMPNSESAGFSGAMQTGSAFSNHLLSCRQAGDPQDGFRYIREGQCVWARLSGRRLVGDGSRDGIAFAENASMLSAGAQLRMQGDWRIGAGFGFEQADLNTKSQATMQTERIHLGGVIKYVPGPWTFAATVNGGVGRHDSVRRISFGDYATNARGEADSSFIAGRLTSSYLMSFGNWYLKPQLELAATQLSRDAYTETSNGGAALRVAQSDGTVLSAAPSLEIGAEHKFAGAIYRAFVNGGATFRDTEVFVTTASFADTSVVTAPFAISSRIDRVTGDVGAGIDAILARGTTVRFQYDGKFGETTTHHSGAAKLGVKF